MKPLGKLALLVGLGVAVAQTAALAQGPGQLTFSGLLPDPNQPRELAAALQIVIGLAVLSLAPGLLIMLTCFTRIIIILSFLRSALGTQQTPPNAVLIGLALFLTFFVMNPVWEEVNREALQPYLSGKLAYPQALERGSQPVHAFLLRQTREKDLALFIGLARIARPQSPAEVPMRVLVPAFIISELRTAFQIGFVLFIPFVVLDLVVGSVLMSLGMMMLPPVMVSLPLKILLFVMVDGWHLVTRSVIMSFA